MHKSLKSLSGFLFGIMGLFLFFAAGCGPAEPQETLPTEESQPTVVPEANIAAYPISTPIVDAYPGPVSDTPDSTGSAYPALPELEPRADESERFRLDLPLAANSTTVTGYAPNNLPLAIVDVTFAGVILGSGQSDDNGHFEIPVTPLPEGHRIGIALASLDPGVDFQEKLTELYPYRGDGYMMLPDIGVFFETAMSEE